MTHRITRIAVLAGLTVGLLVAVAGIAAGDVTPDQQAAMLAAHNTLRRNVGAQETQRLGRTVAIPDLTWNPMAATVAQAWANQLLATNTFEHNPNRGFLGENIFFESGPDPATSGDRAFGDWAAEAASYTWETNACAGVCGHYTQLVWAGTTSVGCGMATDGTTTYWVCDYAPPGNITGRRPYEPGGPASQPPVTQPAATQPPATEPPVAQPSANPSPVAQPSVAPPPAATGGPVTWSGSWTVADFGWGAGGTLTLTQDGNRVAGTYSYLDLSGCGAQNGTVTGTVTAAVLTLNVIETGCAGDGTGTAILTRSADGASFTGSWSGTRTGQPPAAQPPSAQPSTTPPVTQPPAAQPTATPPSVTQPPAAQPRGAPSPAATSGAATWTGASTVADFGWGAGGTLTLTQDGNQVSGTYTYADPSGCGTQRGVVTGTFDAGVLTLTYSEAGCAGLDSGGGTLLLSADGARFTGFWSGTWAGP